MSGYKILDLKNTNFTSGTASTVSGAYDALANSYNKPVIVSGLVVSDTAYPDLWSNFINNSGTYIAKYRNFGTISVASGDSVTVALSSTT